MVEAPPVQLEQGQAPALQGGSVDAACVQDHQLENSEPVCFDDGEEEQQEDQSQGIADQEVGLVEDEDEQRDDGRLCVGRTWLTVEQLMQVAGDVQPLV
jgi:hypothetical protein